MTKKTTTWYRVNVRDETAVGEHPGVHIRLENGRTVQVQIMAPAGTTCFPSPPWRRKHDMRETNLARDEVLGDYHASCNLLVRDPLFISIEAGFCQVSGRPAKMHGARHGKKGAGSVSARRRRMVPILDAARVATALVEYARFPLFFDKRVTENGKNSYSELLLRHCAPHDETCHRVQIPSADKVLEKRRRRNLVSPRRHTHTSFELILYGWLGAVAAWIDRITKPGAIPNSMNRDLESVRPGALVQRLLSLDIEGS
ncbi:uncharacterized protein B0T23DRAFT_404446 [Neurospora hispaniola]|uniref:Uncharacterized protein n=1 Tax=Neurospora hispaniola TaxID=588809 RepID=A0AAJ0MR76_9PEZI|nr:hypothetical protein B0T23DRAFT_404446 [Neurospora hispaniola]